MPRPPLPLGTWGRIARTETAPGKWVARARFRDFDGHTRKAEAWGRTGAAAERALVTALTARATPTSAALTPGTRMSVLAAAWLVEIERSDLAVGSLNRYRSILTRHVIPGVGGLTIREATVGNLDRFLRAVADHTGTGTAKGCRTVLAAMLALAARHDAAPRVTVRDTAPVRAERKPIKVLTEREVRTLRAKLSTDPSAVRASLPDLVDFMLGTGVRIGEALALRWADLDLGAATPTATIAGTVVRHPERGLVIQDHPKTAAGRRRLLLPQFAVGMLLGRRVAQVIANDLVFPSSTGTLREPQNVHRQWRAARERAGFDWVTPHVFRKSVATVIGLGDLQAAANQLGHSGTAVTEKHYVARTGAGPDARELLEVFSYPADLDENGG